MSLAIEVDDVVAVLLADGWHTVYEDSFYLDSYEFLWGEQVLQGGGQSGICSNGFTFKSADRSYLSGPLTAILAVRTKGGAE